MSKQPGSIQSNRQRFLAKYTHVSTEKDPKTYSKTMQILHANNLVTVKDESLHVLKKHAVSNSKTAYETVVSAAKTYPELTATLKSEAAIDTSKIDTAAKAVLKP